MYIRVYGHAGKPQALRHANEAAVICCTGAAARRATFVVTLVVRGAHDTGGVTSPWRHTLDRAVTRWVRVSWTDQRTSIPEQRANGLPQRRYRQEG